MTRRLLVLLAAVGLAASAYGVFEWDRARRPGYWEIDLSVDASWTGPVGNGHTFTSSESVLKSLPSGFRPTDGTPFGNALLIMAAWNGELGLMRQAYAAGCKVTDVNRVGWTALHAAARYNRLEALKLLLQWGADPNCRTQSNDTPLKFAVWGARPEMVAELLNSGASPRVAGPLGTSLLASAAQQLQHSVWKVDRWRSFQGVPREDRLMLRRVIRTIALLVRAGAPTDDPHFEEALASVPMWLREETYQAIAADAALRERVRVRSLRKPRPVRGSEGARALSWRRRRFPQDRTETSGGDPLRSVWPKPEQYGTIQVKRTIASRSNPVNVGGARTTPDEALRWGCTGSEALGSTCETVEDPDDLLEERTP